MSKPPVIVIAGGSNSRFFPFNKTGHKGLLSIAGKPLMIRMLENLQSHEYREVTLVITPEDAEQQISQKIIEAAHLELKIEYVVQVSPQGMGDAVLSAIPRLQDQFSQIIITSTYHTNAGEVLDQMLTKGNDSVLCTAPTATPWEYGIATLNDQGELTQIVEKPERGHEPSNQKIQVLYVLSENFIEILRNLPVTQYNFEEALSILAMQHPIPVLQLEKALPSLKYPWDAFEMKDQLLSHNSSATHPSAKISATAVIDATKGPVIIEEGASVGHCTRIVGPCFIGKNAFIGDFCLVRDSDLETGVQVGTFSEVARSIFLPGSTMHSGFVGDSIIGQKVKIGAGFVTANKRFDRASVHVEVRGENVDTGRRALGVLIGENAAIGIHTSTMPGKCIAPGAVVYPQTVVKNNIPGT